ncbi:MAG: hypothetical protein NT069_03860 [Planctomycetota bacterium]|nr:hypothetical protein [Planctomycetota bacterium]
MPDSDDEPKWELLPSEPARFFDLPALFDRTELKRRYHSYLRRFKPEFFPTEFQRIRAAYEALDRELRYRETQPLPTLDDASPPIRQTEADPAGTHSLGSPDRHTQPSGFGNLLQLAPEDLHRELTGKPWKTAQEHLLLALLNDARGSGEALDFLVDLLAALNAAPRDFNLHQLFREFLRGDEARARCQEFLERIFAECPRDFVFAATEPLWDELARQVPYPIFRTVFNECLDRVRDLEQSGRIVLEIHLAKRLLFHVQTGWLTETLDRLTQADVNWPGWFDQELWMIERLSDYCRVRHSFLNGDPLRTQLDEMIRAYCEDTPNFDHLYLNFQAKLARDFDSLAAAFPIAPDSTVEVAWQAWNCLCDDVAGRFRNDAPVPIEIALQALSFLPAQLHAAGRPHLFPGKQWGIEEYILFGGCVHFIWAMLFHVQFLFRQGTGTAVFWGLLGLLIGIPAQAVVGEVLTFVSSWFSRRVYCRRLRPVLLAYVRQFPIPVALVAQQLTQYELGARRTERLVSHVGEDVALRMYATAIRLTS